MRKLCLILLVFITLFTAAAQDSPAFILTTSDYSIRDKWSNTVSENGPRLISTDKAVRMQNIFIIPFASVTATDESDHEITYDIQVTAPDGSFYFSKNGILLTENKLQPNTLYMARDFPFVSFKKNDQNGLYNISITVNDLKNNSSYTLSEKIELVDNIESQDFVNDTDFQSWLNTYYLEMDPHRTAKAMQYFVNSPMSSSGSYWPIFGFFNEILKNNEFLRNQLIDNYYNYSPKMRQFVMRQLYFTEDQYSFLFLLNITGDDAASVEEMRKNPPTILSETLYHPTQINYLWGMFFASGRLEPLARIIESLNLMSENQEVYGLAQATIGTNYKTHLLVKQYIDFATEYIELTDIQLQSLEALYK